MEKIAALTTDDKDKEILLLREEVSHLRDHLKSKNKLGAANVVIFSG